MNYSIWVQSVKKNRGITGVDLTIAVVVLLLFVSLITTLFYNVYLSSASTKRAAVANGYLIDVQEQVEKMTYDQAIENSQIQSEDSFVNTIVEKVGKKDLEIRRGKINASTDTTKAYTLGIHVQNYNETTGNQDKKDLVKTIILTIKYKVGKTVEIKESKTLKTKEVPTKDSQGIMPKLEEGMVAVKWVSSTVSGQSGYWQQTTISDPDWFDYGQKKWANIMLKDGMTTDEYGKVLTQGSMFVYLPRFAYQIPANSYHTAKAGEIKIKFLTIANECLDGSSIQIQSEVTSSIAGVAQNSSTGYIVHPAFRFANQELEGIWMAKYEASNPNCSAEITTGQVTYSSVADKRVTAKEGVTSWRSITIGQAYEAARNMLLNDRSYYGITNEKLDSHLIRNTEWGACSYLAQSRYGKQVQVTNNTSATYIAGAGGTESSTTGNETGVYDMAGGSNEYVSAYVNNVHINLTKFGENVINGAEKYKTIYLSGATEGGQTNYEQSQKQYGDAIWETSDSFASEGGSWYLNGSQYPFSSTPFFVRGGHYNSGSSAGLYYFGNSTGEALDYNSFRVCLTNS